MVDHMRLDCSSCEEEDQCEKIRVYKRNTEESFINGHFLIFLLDQLLTRNPNDGVDDGVFLISRMFVPSSPRSKEVKLEVPTVKEPIKTKYTPDWEPTIMT